MENILTLEEGETGGNSRAGLEVLEEDAYIIKTSYISIVKK